MKASQPPVEEIVERLLDLVIGIDAHARGAMLGDELIGRPAGLVLPCCTPITRL